MCTVEAHPSRPGVVFAGLKPVAIFRSEDFGETWTESPIGDVPLREKWSSRSFRIRRRRETYRYIPATLTGSSRDRGGRRLAVTRRRPDLGTTRQRPDLGRSGPTDRPDVHVLLIDPFNPDLLYCTLGNGFCISFDRGETWESRTNGIHATYVRAIDADRTQPGRLIASGSKLPPFWLHKTDPEAPQYGEADARYSRRLTTPSTGTRLQTAFRSAPATSSARSSRLLTPRTAGS